MTQEEHLEGGHQPINNSVYDQVSSDDSDRSKNTAASNQLGCARSNSISAKTDTADKELIAIETDNVVSEAIDQGGQDGTVGHSTRGDQNNNVLKMTVISHQNSGENIREIQTKIENSEKSVCAGDSSENTEIIQKDCENSQATSENLERNVEKNVTSEKVIPNSNDKSDNVEIVKHDEDDPFARLRALKANISNVLKEVKAVLTEHGVNTPEETEKNEIKPSEDNAIRFRFVRRIRKRSVFDEDEKKAESGEKELPLKDIEVSQPTEEIQNFQEDVQPSKGNQNKKDIQKDIGQPNDDKPIDHGIDQDKGTIPNKFTSDKLETISSIDGPNAINQVKDIPSKANDKILDVSKETKSGPEEKNQSTDIQSEISPDQIIKMQESIDQRKEVINSSNANEIASILQIQENLVDTKQNGSQSRKVKDETVTESNSTTEESQDSSLSVGLEYEVKLVDVISVSELPAPSPSHKKKVKEAEGTQKKTLKNKAKATAKEDTSAKKIKKSKTDEAPKKIRKSSLSKDRTNIESFVNEDKKTIVKTKSKKMESLNKKISEKALVSVKTNEMVSTPSNTTAAATRRNSNSSKHTKTVGSTSTTTPSKTSIPESSKQQVPVETNKIATQEELEKESKPTSAKPSSQIVPTTPKQATAQNSTESEKIKPIVKQDQPKTETKTQDKKQGAEKVNKTGNIDPNSKTNLTTVQHTLPEEASVQDKSQQLVTKDETISNSSIFVIPMNTNNLPQGLETEELAKTIVEPKTSANTTCPTPALAKEPKATSPVTPLISKEATQVKEEPQVLLLEKVALTLPQKVENDSPSRPKPIPSKEVSTQSKPTEVEKESPGSIQPKSIPSNTNKDISGVTSFELMSPKEKDIHSSVSLQNQSRPSYVETEASTATSSPLKSMPTAALEKVLATTNLKLTSQIPPPIAPPTNVLKESTETIGTKNKNPSPVNLDKDAQRPDIRRNFLPAAIPSDVTPSREISTSSLKDEKIISKPDVGKISSQQTPTPSATEACGHDDKSDKSMPQNNKVMTTSDKQNQSDKAIVSTEEARIVDKVPLKIESNKIGTVAVKPALTVLPSPVKAVQLAPTKLELVAIPKPSQLAVVQVRPTENKAVVIHQPKDEQPQNSTASDIISVSLQEKEQEKSTEKEQCKQPAQNEKPIEDENPNENDKSEKPEEGEKPGENEKLNDGEKPNEKTGAKLCPKKRKMKKKVVIKRIRRRLSTDGTIVTRRDSLESAEPEICEKVIGVKFLEPEPEPEPEPEEVKPPPGPRSCLKIREYQPGDIVLYADRIKKTVKWKKAEVLERITSISYKLNVEGEEKSCHICYIKKYTDKKVQFGGKEYLEIDYAQEESSDEEEIYNIWARV